MDPPMRPTGANSDIFSLGGPSNFSSFPSTSDSLPTSPAAPRSLVGTASQPQDKTKGPVRSTRPMQDAPQYDTLGQLSFAPATQTTVVVTTTTTTTNFPPFVMRTPSQLHDLDPKLYPLAATPTPQSMKRFCFDIDGKPTFFREAEATGETLQEVKSSNHLLQSWLDCGANLWTRNLVVPWLIHSTFGNYSFSAITKLCNRPEVSSNQGQATSRKAAFQSPMTAFPLSVFPKTSSNLLEQRTVRGVFTI